MTNNGMPPEEQTAIEIFQMKQDLIRLQAQISRLESASDDDGGSEDHRGDEPEPVRFVSLGSGISGQKSGDTLSLTAFEQDATDEETRHFKLVTSIGSDVASSGVKVRDGNWTRNGAYSFDLDGGTPPDDAGSDVAVTSTWTTPGALSTNKHYVYLELTSSTSTDPALEPDGLSALAIRVDDWVADFRQNHIRQIIGEVTIDENNLVTAFEEYEHGGDIDDTQIVVDGESNALSTNADAGNADDVVSGNEVSQTINWNSRWELQLGNAENHLNNTINDVDWSDSEDTFVVIDNDGGHKATAVPGNKFMTLATLVSLIEATLDPGDLTNPVEHDDLAFGPSSNPTGNGSNVDHDERYWMATGVKNPGHNHGVYGADTGDYETDGTLKITNATSAASAIGAINISAGGLFSADGAWIESADSTRRVKACINGESFALVISNGDVDIDAGGDYYHLGVQGLSTDGHSGGIYTSQAGLNTSIESKVLDLAAGGFI